MSDAPAAALLLAALALFLRARAEGPDRCRWTWPAAGFVIALTAGLRPALAAAVLPFLVEGLRGPGWKRWLRAAAAAAPLAALLLAGLLWNRAVFGSWTRGGYPYWCSVPCDYPGMMFSLRHLPANLLAAQQTGLLFPGLLLLAFVAVRARRAARTGAASPLPGIALFAALALTPALALHALFVFHEPRFFLPAAVVLATAAAAAAAPWTAGLGPRRALAAAALLLALAGTHRALSREPAPWRRDGAERVRAHTPADAVILTGLDPVYLRLVLGRDDARTLVPLSRDVEYASKLVTPRRIPHPDPPPAHATDHRCAGLLNAGAHEAVTFVASERSAEIAAWVSGGRPVFLDRSHLAHGDRDEIRRLEQAFRLEEVAPGLERLRSR